MPKKINHILVIRLSAMGDVAMTIPVLLALLRKNPQLKITVLSKSFLKPIFEAIPNVTFYTADVKGKHKGVFGLYTLYKELKKLNIDAVADLHNVLRSKILGFFFKLGGIKTIKLDKGRSEKKALTRSKNKIFKPLQPTYLRYSSVFVDLGFPITFSDDDVLPQLELQPQLATYIGKDAKPWIGIAPFAAFEGKTYPLALQEQLIQQLDASGKYKIILFGGKADKVQLDTWSKAYKNVVNCAAQFSFSEELAIISNLDVMVSMDSGNAHLAAMYGKKVITLWGVTHPYAGFYPYGQPEHYALLPDMMQFPLVPTSVYGNKFPEGYEKVMHSIAPETVFSKIEEVLKQ